MPASPRIRALVFDFDGVVIETETPVMRAWQEIYAEHGHVLPVERWPDIVGTQEKLFDPVGDLEERLGRGLDWDTIHVWRRDRQWALVSAEELRPGVLGYLEDAARLGLRLGIASGSSRQWVEGHLRERGLYERFDTVVTRDDVAAPKPDPAAYVRACELLGVEAREALAFEDSEHGLLAAKGAGLRCVVVPHDLTAHLAFERADLRLESLADVSLEGLLARFGG